MENPLFLEISSILHANGFEADGRWKYNVNYKRFDRILIGRSQAHISIFYKQYGYHTTYRGNSEISDMYGFEPSRRFHNGVRRLDDLYDLVKHGKFKYRWDITSEITDALAWLKNNR